MNNRRFWMILSVVLSLTCVAMSEQYSKAVERLADQEMLLKDNRSTIMKLEQNMDDLNDQLLSLMEEKNQIQQENEQLRQERDQILQENEQLKSRNAIQLSSEELYLFYRLVEAEAGGESIEGRIAVANVVINRMKSEKYPDTLKGVIYQKHQFEVVDNGMINTKIPSEGTKEAVDRALKGEEVVPEGTVIFWAKYLDPGHSIWKHCEVIASIGVHNFAKEWK